MYSNSRPFQVQMIGHDPDSRCASSYLYVLPRGLLDLVLDQTVRPRDPHGVRLFLAPEPEHQRDRVELLLIARAGLHLDLRSDSAS